LSGDKPVTLLIYGGHADQVVEKLVEAVENRTVDTNPACVCGRNEALRDRLDSRGFSKLKLATGFVDVAPYYAAADLVVDKPGPGVITEVSHMARPCFWNTTAAPWPRSASRPNGPRSAA
jgi:UDP-N-acetylglucosamine:LPS N-acetylglucosamine transferase